MKETRAPFASSIDSKIIYAWEAQPASQSDLQAEKLFAVKSLQQRVCNLAKISYQEKLKG